MQCSAPASGPMDSLASDAAHAALGNVAGKLPSKYRSAGWQRTATTYSLSGIGGGTL